MYKYIQNYDTLQMVHNQERKVKLKLWSSKVLELFRIELKLSINIRR